MKVILLQDVAKIGRKFEVAEVSHGYALNMLIPKGLAKEATKQNLKNIEAMTSKLQADRTASNDSFSTALEELKKKSISITVEANEKGHLFEALKSDKISEAIKGEGVSIDAKQIFVSAPIKEVGEHTVELREGDLQGSVVVKVVAK